jgi:hypothetical protein
MVLKSVAGKVIQKRALTGSLTSVFYLRSSGMKEAAEAERIFLVSIGIPMAVLGVTGLWFSIKTNKW